MCLSQANTNMDFLDPKKKQAHARRLYLGYFLMGIALLLAASILLILSNGYDVDRKTGQVIQNGLIFTNSAPESTTIYLNGKANGQTDKRLTVPEGTYNVELQRTGYTTWKKTVQLDGGNIERLVYPRLFPSKLTTAVSKTYDAIPSFSAQSPDRRWLLVTQPGQFNSFDIYDTGKPTQAATVTTIPEGVLTKPAAGAAETLTMVEWSTDNRHVLVKHTFGDAFEYAVIDRSSTENNSYNVTKVTGLSPTLVALHDKKYDRLFIYDATAKTLQTVNVEDKTVAPLLGGVLAFKPYGSKTVLYASEDDVHPGKTLLRILDDGKNYTMRTFDTPSSLLLDLAEFDGSMYVTAASTTEGRLYIYKDPLARLKSDSKTALTPFVLIRFKDPTKISFSANTRFVAMQSGTRFAVYDFEEARRYNFTLPGELPADQFASWMDGHRLVLNQANTVQVFEFDGANQTKLGSLVANSLPFFDRDYIRCRRMQPVRLRLALFALVSS